MGTRAHLLWLACLAAGCGAGGNGNGESGGTNGGSASSLTGNLTLLAHSPAPGEVQVPVDTTIHLEFDAGVVAECLRDPDTGLWTAAGAAVDGSFATTDGGRSLAFTPAVPLAEATDYVFRMAPLTGDNSGRILEVERSFGFRTLDLVPPRLVSTSVVGGATGVHRTEPILCHFDEALAPASVGPTAIHIKDAYGTDHPVTCEVDGATVRVQPVADLAGDRQYILGIRGGTSGALTDRAGNALAEGTTVRFWTAVDTTPPQVLSIWPAQADGPMSPKVIPAVVFSESIDPFSVEPSSVAFLDEFGNLVPYAAIPSADRRTLRLKPEHWLIPGRGYRIALVTGAAGLTDVTGNPMVGSPVVTQWTCGTDGDAPTVVQTTPSAAAQQVSLTATIAIEMSEGLDPRRVNLDTVDLRDGAGTRMPFTVVTQNLDQRILVVPTYDLDPGTSYTVTLLAGDDGVRDKAGNPLEQGLALTFSATDDPTAPSALLQPPDGATAVSPDSVVSAVFDAPLDPDSVHAGTVSVTDSHGAPIAGTLQLLCSDRVVVFAPTAPWLAGATYTATYRGGAEGLRKTTGNTLRQDTATSFRIGFSTDVVVPDVTLRINRIGAERSAGLVVPPSGFTFDIEVRDGYTRREDMGDFELILRGPGTAGAAGPSQDVIYQSAAIDRHEASWTVPADRALAPGTYTAQAVGRDLSGNAGYSDEVGFEVISTDSSRLPFDRIQVVWVRTDLDRDGTGSADFEEDLLRLGLNAEGDPAGTNARMAAILRDGIIGHANRLFGRASTGAPLGADSVPVRLSFREPLGVAHMQMALGGFDPEGSRDRTYGESSTGVLGRAIYDYRNRVTNERNISLAPGLGIFPAEMFLYQARLHLQVYPGFLTSFGRRFINLAPDMGGTPAGTHPLDPTVLAEGFDHAGATTPEKARFDQVFVAADEWATAIGIILAHEIGHSVGLVAPGDNFAGGLHGDASLHNQFSAIGEVMASSVGYDALVTVDYGFRDLNAAYLRQRLLLR